MNIKICIQEQELCVDVVRKRIKNMVLRISGDGEIHLSLPMRTAESQALDFVNQKSGWIVEKRSKILTLNTCPETPSEVAHGIIAQSLERVYPSVENFGIKMPQLRIKAMKTRWGSCSLKTGYITINSALASLPRVCLDYVVLHELAHFAYPDHSKRFYDFISSIMPEWQAARKELNNYKLT